MALYVLFVFNILASSKNRYLGNNISYKYVIDALNKETYIDVPSEEINSSTDASVKNRLEQISNYSTSQLKA